MFSYPLHTIQINEEICESDQRERRWLQVSERKISNLNDTMLKKGIFVSPHKKLLSKKVFKKSYLLENFQHGNLLVCDERSSQIPKRMLLQPFILHKTTKLKNILY